MVSLYNKVISEKLYAETISIEYFGINDLWVLLKRILW